MKVEVAGICGTDVKMYSSAIGGPVIMGHENIGIIAKAGRKFTERKGFREGDRVFVEHYVACGKCEWCHIGQYRHCEATDWRYQSGRASATATPRPSTRRTCGAGSRNTSTCRGTPCCTRCRDNVTAELAGIVTPLANGIEWALFDASVGYGSTVLIQGPGQQGLSQVVACKQAGAD